jgi:hypothetical protein
MNLLEEAIASLEVLMERARRANQSHSLGVLIEAQSLIYNIAFRDRGVQKVQDDLEADRSPPGDCGEAGSAVQATADCMDRQGSAAIDMRRQFSENLQLVKLRMHSIQASKMNTKRSRI